MKWFMVEGMMRRKISHSNQMMCRIAWHFQLNQ